jgi:hypothetical protein
MPGEFQIVGIASDATLDDPRTLDAPAIYAVSFQRPDWLGWSDAIIRTPGDPARMAGAFRARIESLGREYPLRIETVGDELDHALMPERILTLLTSFFGALGLLLAAVGLYGLLSYTVSRRTAEIGVRVALGAPRAAIARLMLRDVATLLAIGLTAGLALAWTGSRAIAAFLYGLSSHDPAALTAAALVLILVALAASLLPSLRAVRVDPLTALRHLTIAAIISSTPPIGRWSSIGQARLSSTNQTNLSVSAFAKNCRSRKRASPSPLSAALNGPLPEK